MLVILIIVLLLIEMNEDKLYFLAAVSITFASSNLSLAVFVPVVLKKTISSIKSSGQSSDRGSSHREGRSKRSKRSQKSQKTVTDSRDSRVKEEYELNNERNSADEAESSDNATDGVELTTEAAKPALKVTLNESTGVDTSEREEP